MRVDKTRNQTKWCHPIRRIFHQFTPCEKTHLFVIFDLESSRRHTGLNDRIHIVIPFINAFIRRLPIRRPGEIGRIDIGGDTFFKAVQLIWPDEMHLARQTGAIAHPPQIMGECRHAGRELAGIVIGGDTRHMLARHKTET